MAASARPAVLSTPTGMPAWLQTTVTSAEREAWEERAAVAEYMQPQAPSAAAATAMRAKAEKLATECLLAARKRRTMAGRDPELPESCGCGVCTRADEQPAAEGGQGQGDDGQGQEESGEGQS